MAEEALLNALVQGSVQTTPSIVILTQDSALWAAWKSLHACGWDVQRATCLADVQPWYAASQDKLVMLDSELADWAHPAWQELLAQLRTLVLTTHVSDEQGKRVLAYGAHGYAHANLPTATLDRILCSIEAGSIWMGHSLLQRLLQDIDHRISGRSTRDWVQQLSLREAEVADLAAVGRSNADIAQSLHITERTVRAHLSSIFEKLQVHDRLQLALKVHGIQA